MNSEIKILLIKEKELFLQLLQKLDEQHNFITSKNLLGINRVNEEIENISSSIASSELKRRSLIPENVEFKEMVASSDDELLKEIFNEINAIVLQIKRQNEANTILLKQELFFTKKMLNLITPSQNSLGVYDKKGRID